MVPCRRWCGEVVDSDGGEDCGGTAFALQPSLRRPSALVGEDVGTDESDLVSVEGRQPCADVRGERATAKRRRPGQYGLRRRRYGGMDEQFAHAPMGAAQAPAEARD